MEQDKGDKIERVLSIYTKLLDGKIVNKAELAQEYGVNERSIQRDIEDIRMFMDKEELQTGVVNSVIYDRTKNGYRLEQLYKMKFTNSEVLAICKILLDSRAFTKKEMDGMLQKLIDCCVPKTNQKMVTELIRNEQFHYIEPQHKTVFIDKMWELGQAIQQKKYVEIEYLRLKDKSVVTRKIKPVAIMFSEYYFYVTAFIEEIDEIQRWLDKKNSFNPTIYRIDRIQSIKICDEHFRMPYSNRFEEGEFRKRIQFMHGGRLRKVKFKYSGLSLEAVLDRLPTAKILDEEDGVYTIEVEVFGNGIDMWLRSQGDMIKMYY